MLGEQDVLTLEGLLEHLKEVRWLGVGTELSMLDVCFEGQVIDVTRN